ncbi:hypothetical protein B0H66DRAFT_270764 [Apodospora peruviana]|uniref:U1-C C2H2-type zinc finger domain-containing protein n=1 Tax=Apodospora peruviana TaxID=516989 RepID=A0AAE0I001_9PEZI|nr:hypothetical protein B0H66DRAFT_270764 [Apodospora peruviana]
MSEYWKSTPKYWCKHCSVYVRDTKLERTNHEATGKHQGALKRSLRDLHRGAEQKERDKEHAKREVERLNGIVSGSSSASSSAPSPRFAAGGAQQQQPQKVTEAERQRQLEQLAELGVSIPTELRGNMAMAGEWTVTSTKVVEEPRLDEDGSKIDHTARVVGVKRERERTEEEKEQEEAIRGLFKKPRRWGVDSKRMPAEEDDELEALLSGSLPVKTKKKEESPTPAAVKKEDDDGVGGGVQDGMKTEVVNKEEDESGLPPPPPLVKKESGVEDGEKHEGSASASGVAASAAGPELDLSAVGGMFKKRKPKKK